MTNETNDTFTTDSSPGEQAFENTVDEAVAGIEKTITTSEVNGYGPRMARVLRSSVRESLAADGIVSPEQVAHELSARDSEKETVEPINRRLEVMIDESGPGSRLKGGGKSHD